jgi:hypothetical protein
MQKRFIVVQLNKNRIRVYILYVTRKKKTNTLVFVQGKNVVVARMNIYFKLQTAALQIKNMHLSLF